ncbi:hypothetical protein CcaverHIS002_0111230 [Cutaneotrichosporon cavernicola]|nr:hypothetical protein CcaverHIS002_0111230 [Cutaneotrichosporon cavernicola]BEI96167.1 hypothetical protein CcaverHIS631_0111160 [Cutaneotrichosporon cavernicola]
MSYPYLARTILKYKSPHATDLSFAKNETIRVTGPSDDDEDWLVGESMDGERKGGFPRDFIQVIEEDESEAAVPVAAAVAAGTSAPADTTAPAVPAAASAALHPPAPSAPALPSTSSIDESSVAASLSETPPAAAAVVASEPEAAAPPPAVAPAPPVAAQLPPSQADKSLSAIDTAPVVSDQPLSPIKATSPVRPKSPVKTSPTTHAPAAPAGAIAANPGEGPRQSMKDRLAFFNKPQSKAPPPPIKPKPVGGALTWSQRQKLRLEQEAKERDAEAAARPASGEPSQPENPAAPAAAEPVSGPTRSPPEPEQTKEEGEGMSAADAAKSARAGGSLKERMAALQAGGAFGRTPAPPPPKPSGKVWSRPPPPPAPEPVEGEEDDGEVASAPAPVHRDASPGTEGEAAEAEASQEVPVEEEEQDVDEEEQEKQRRAAIAARMAKLGTRGPLGMSPMMGAPRPIPARKPTRQATEETPAEEAAPTAAPVPIPGMAHTAQPVRKSTEDEMAQEQPTEAAGSPPADAATSQPSESTSTAPVSVKLPAVPRRTAGPRRRGTPSVPSPAPPATTEDTTEDAKEEGQAGSSFGVPAMAAAGTLAAGATAAAAIASTSPPISESQSAAEPPSVPVGASVPIPGAPPGTEHRLERTLPDGTIEPPPQVMVAGEEESMPLSPEQRELRATEEAVGSGVLGAEGAQLAGIALLPRGNDDDDEIPSYAPPHTAERLERKSDDGTIEPPPQIPQSGEEEGTLSPVHAERHETLEMFGRSHGGVEGAEAAGIALSPAPNAESAESHVPPPPPRRPTQDDEDEDEDDVPPPPPARHPTQVLVAEPAKTATPPPPHTTDPAPPPGVPSKREEEDDEDDEDDFVGRAQQLQKRDTAIPAAGVAALAGAAVAAAMASKQDSVTPPPPNRPNPARKPSLPPAMHTEGIERIASHGSITATSPISPVRAIPPAPLAAQVEEEGDEETQRRASIAARMAKLGGIRFGAPPPMPIRKRSTLDEETTHASPSAELPPTSDASVLRPEPEETDQEVPAPPPRAPPAPAPADDGEETPEQEAERRRKTLARLRAGGMLGGGLFQAAREDQPEESPHTEVPDERGIEEDADDDDEPEEEDLPPPPPRRPSHTARSVPPVAVAAAPPAAGPPPVPGVRPPVPVPRSSLPPQPADDEDDEEDAPPPPPHPARSMSSEAAGAVPPPRAAPPTPPVDDEIEDAPAPPPRPPHRMSSFGVPQHDDGAVAAPHPPVAPQAARRTSVPPVPHAPQAAPAARSFAAVPDPSGGKLPPPTEPQREPSPGHSVHSAHSAPRSSSQVARPGFNDLQHMSQTNGAALARAARGVFDQGRRGFYGDGSPAGFLRVVFDQAHLPVPSSGHWGMPVYEQQAQTIMKRLDDPRPGDVAALYDARFKGQKGLKGYTQHVGSVEDALVGVIGEYETKGKHKIRVLHVERGSPDEVSYRLDDLKSGRVVIYRVGF